MLPSYTRAALAHRRAGIGACFLTMTHARFRRSPGVELGATDGDGAPIWQGHCAACRIHGRDQVAFRD